MHFKTDGEDVDGLGDIFENVKGNYKLGETVGEGDGADVVITGNAECAFRCVEDDIENGG